MTGSYSSFSCFALTVDQTIHPTGKIRKYLKSIIEQKHIFSCTTSQIFTGKLSILNEIRCEYVFSCSDVNCHLDTQSQLHSDVTLISQWAVRIIM